MFQSHSASSALGTGSSAKHKAFAAEQGAIQIAIVTVSDSRTPETDTNYHYLEEQIIDAGHQVSEYHLIKDDPTQVIIVLKDLVQTPVQVILFNGGTGISRRDTTYDALHGCLEKIMPGFGELFRMLSYEQIGSAAMLSRALAGVYHGKVIFATPGSPAAVQLAWKKLIAPELQHLTWEIAR